MMSCNKSNFITQQQHLIESAVNWVRANKRVVCVALAVATLVQAVFAIASYAWGILPVLSLVLGGYGVGACYKAGHLHMAAIHQWLFPEE